MGHPVVRWVEPDDGGSSKRLIATIGIVLGLLFLRSHGTLDDFSYTHWLFDYEAGFVKRGLVGESLHPGQQRSRESP